MIKLPDSIKSIVSDDKGPLSREELVIGESMRTLELAILSELNECLDEFDNNSDLVDPNLARVMAELQYALDIVQSACTNEEKRRVYEILKNIGKYP
ncbi:MAG: hypothetical protein GY829_06485 [Gammaproteobacteria bacterium]|nr:hypothetical protein [Gammaproteobacteria bacterium]